MFGTNKDQTQVDPATAQTGNDAHASLGVSESQIENAALELEQASAGPHTIASAPTAPPINEPAPQLNTALSSLDSSSNTDSASDTSAPEKVNPEPPVISDNAPHPPATAPIAAEDEDSLLDIKKDALQNLAPLVDKLEQTPEEKFKTTMMLIQASDNSALIKDAYDAANSITDEKKRAQALLDVVNEINYFTQNPKDIETK